MHLAVTYSRKLALGGLSVFVGRGTMTQSYFVASVEAIYLMFHMRQFPYVRKQHNQVDSLGHMALLLVRCVALLCFLLSYSALQSCCCCCCIMI